MKGERKRLRTEMRLELAWIGIVCFSDDINDTEKRER